MRTEEKKRESARTKEAQESVPATPVIDVPPTPVDVPVTAELVEEIHAEAEAAVVEETPIPADTKVALDVAQYNDEAESGKAEQDVPHATIEVSYGATGCASLSDI